MIGTLITILALSYFVNRCVPAAGTASACRL